MKITDAVNDLQLLSNIGDLAVAGTAITGTAVDSAAVTVSIGTTSIIDETLYSDEDGTIWIRDVKSLLKPYIDPASVVNVSISVGSTDYSVKVLYCMAALKNETSDTNLEMLRGNFLTTAWKKRVGMATAVNLPVFGFYSWAKSINLSLAVLCSVDGGAPEQKSISIALTFTAGVTFMYVDVSPARVRGFLATQLSVEEDDIYIYGYKVGYDYFDYHPEMTYIVSDEVPPLTLIYQNAFGAWETQPVFGSDVVERDYSITNAKLAGKLKRIDSRLTKGHTFTIPLSSDVDNEIAEAVIASPSLQLYDNGVWRDITITEYSHETDEQLGTENAISFTYEWQENDHRKIDQRTAPSGTVTVFGGYEPDGMVLQYDCESGASSAKWLSCEIKGFDVQTLTGAFTFADDGAVILSSAASLSKSIEGLGSAYTLEACILPASTELGTIVETNGKLIKTDADYLYSADQKIANPITASTGITVSVQPGKIYVNGEASTVTAEATIGGTDFTIGDGTVYSVRVYNRALSATEVAANNQIDEERWRIPSNAFILGNGQPFILGNGGFFLLNN